MNKLSVIIVNYNVKFFLQQAITAALAASKNMAVEIWMVDNQSSDGSVEMVRSLFPEVKVIANEKNVGFSTANNQAIAQSNSEYILLLNPDTVVAEDTFDKCIAFMDAHPNAGGLGVKMIDGTGVFLPESKRGFPSPIVAFFKTFGFGKIFSKSAFFNQYYLGHLPNDANCKADVLSGAFMLMRTKALEEVGYLDETFFMYGEDIDLSYRIVQGGWDNYYIADTSIIHYKGESTKKGSLNYVKTFYQAMIIFTEKHFSKRKGAWLFIIMLQIGIYFRASLTLLANFLKSIAAPLVDAALIFAGLYLLKDLWATSHFKNPDYFPDSLLYINFPIYIGIWLFCMYLRGCYDKHSQYRQIWSALIFGTILVAALYGFLPEDLRYSRMLIILGGIWAIFSTTAIRILKQAIQYKNIFHVVAKKGRDTLIVGSQSEAARTLHILHNFGTQFNYLGHISTIAESQQNEHYLGEISDKEALLKVFQPTEIIFTAKDISNKEIIDLMDKHGNQYEYKILQADNDSIIGSNSKNTAGDLYAVGISYKLNTPTERRNKRIIDIVMSLILLLFSPIGLFFVKGNIALIPNLLKVLIGKATLVGYNESVSTKALPKIKKGILKSTSHLKMENMQAHLLHKINVFYAKDYNVYHDIYIVLKSFSKLGA